MRKTTLRFPNVPILWSFAKTLKIQDFKIRNLELTCQCDERMIAEALTFYKAQVVTDIVKDDKWTKEFLPAQKALTKHATVYNNNFTTNFYSAVDNLQGKQQGHPGKGGRFLTNDLNYERPSHCKDISRLYSHWLNIVNITPVPW